MPGDQRKHLLLSGTGQVEPYKPRPGRGPSRQFPGRQRQEHAGKLRADLDRAWLAAMERRQAPRAIGLGAREGVCLEFRSDPAFALAFERLERRPAGMELLSVRTVGEVTTAAVFVPEGKVEHFVKLIEDYRERQTPGGVPRNRELIESIAEIRLAAIESFWTDDPDAFPPAEVAISWEVWLRRNSETDAAGRFSEAAVAAGLQVDGRRLDFPERTVLLVRGTAAQIAASVDALDAIAELRRARPTAARIMRMSGPDQRRLVDDALGRLKGPEPDAPAVCLLDTGVNRAHPLLMPGLDAADMHAVDPNWGTNDHHGHGTQMAGLALYGDLTPIVMSTDPIELQTRLESVKLLPPRGENSPELYGALTAQAVSRAEIQAPQRRRTVCLTSTVADYRDRGQPTSWSAEIDALCAGVQDEHPRLLFAAAGNTAVELRDGYPDINVTTSVQDPGQSWNAVTVGAHTEKVLLEDEDFRGWTPLAPRGDLSPSTTTSGDWAAPWPTKPDIVCEGGNMARSPAGDRVDYADALQLLTTSHDLLVRPFVVTGDTSAATAEAARVAALIYVAYPDLWPETVRALLVHSAGWTQAMRDRFAPRRRADVRYLLRCCGFGVPDLETALWSAGNVLTLLVQDELQPFEKADMKEMQFHRLPWPKEVLESLGETPVELRVTLSYFIEPNPGRRGWVQKFRYMSHGLRFGVKRPEETLDEFRKRLNVAAREEEERRAPSAGDARGWQLGPVLRSHGSIHSDRWHGTAAALAGRGIVGVYPVTGWWRERKHLGRSTRKARYALVVTLRTPPEVADIYTPVLTQVPVAV